MAAKDHQGIAAPCYAAAIDHLEPFCTQGRSEIADLADAGFTHLEANGVQQTRLAVLIHIREFVHTTAGKVDCQALLATYLHDAEHA